MRTVVTCLAARRPCGIRTWRIIRGRANTKLAVEPRLDSRFGLAPATRLDPLSTNHLDADPFLGLRGPCVHGFISTPSVDQHQTGTAQPRPDSVNPYIERQYSCHLCIASYRVGAQVLTAIVLTRQRSSPHLAWRLSKHEL